MEMATWQLDIWAWNSDEMPRQGHRRERGSSESTWGHQWITWKKRKAQAKNLSLEKQRTENKEVAVEQ